MHVQLNWGLSLMINDDVIKKVVVCITTRKSFFFLYKMKYLYKKKELINCIDVYNNNISTQN